MRRVPQRFGDGGRLISVCNLSARSGTRNCRPHRCVGANVPQWKVGQRAGIGWYGGHCRRCEPCRRGDLVACQNPLIPGLTYDGGYAEYVVAPAEAIAAVPDSLNSVDAAPLLCAGITTFNALRNTGAKPPDTVAVLGMG